jgi:hypothetical protein
MNLRIDSDALAFAQAYAAATGISLGVAVGELILQARETLKGPLPSASQTIRDPQEHPDSAA